MVPSSPDTAEYPPRTPQHLAPVAAKSAPRPLSPKMSHPVSRNASNDSSVTSPAESSGAQTPLADGPANGPMRASGRVWDPARGVEIFKRGSEEVLARFLRMGSWENDPASSCHVPGTRATCSFPPSAHTYPNTIIMSGTGNFASVVSGSQPIDRDAKPTKSAFDTTAALAQQDASNPGEARIMNKNAFVEKSAAEEAAERAREAGEKLTGKPEGDANAEAVKRSLMSTEVKFDQIHNDGSGASASQSMTGKATETAKGATEQASKTAQGALNTVTSTASNAYNAAAITASNALNNVTSTASSTANTASNKASETANSASQTASQAANTASNKASAAANTASDKASQAANTASETGTGILGTLSSTAGSVVNAATGTASSVLSAAQQFVGIGSNTQEGADLGVPKENVQTGKGVATKREGADAHVAETAPSSSEGGFGSFIGGLAQAALKEATNSGSDVSKTGGAEYNSPHHSGQHTSGTPHFNQDEVVKTAAQHGSGESSLFQTALSFLSDNKARPTDKEAEPIDEDEATRAHEKVYQKNDTSGLSASALGSAAALQVLKQFVGGGSSTSSHTTSASSHSAASGGGTTQLISLAMAEATKLFDKSGGQVNGDKQDAVNGAAMTIMKLLVQSKFGGAPTTGGKDSGGLSGLLSLASQFAK
ncbi:hypothetical protein NMY22_g19686 [Coprinellus aureogranulatus]|nr:hypothetical protein NMY22_g19686 [Coprinellus aureogranulatus]